MRRPFWCQLGWHTWGWRVGPEGDDRTWRMCLVCPASEEPPPRRRTGESDLDWLIRNMEYAARQER